MTDPTLSPHKPPVIEDDRELIDRLMNQTVVRKDDLYAALAENERLKKSLLEASNRLDAFGDFIGAVRARAALSTAKEGEK